MMSELVNAYIAPQVPDRRAAQEHEVWWPGGVDVLVREPSGRDRPKYRRGA